MDYYTMSSSGQDYSTVDELLDFSNDDTNNTFSPSHNDVTLHQHCSNVTSSSSPTDNNTNTFNYSYNNSNENRNYEFATAYTHSTNFTDNLCVPSDDVAELEWLSNFVHDSFSNFPANNVAGTINYRPENTSFHSRSRTKRTRAPTHNTTPWTSSSSTTTTPVVKIEAYSSPTSSSSDNTTERRCTHCSSEKTPQWRTGPLGPKTLCNACGVRYKSGRLVPEYRPAASPTFVLTQHSNSHRKVMELRRQKEMMIGGQPQQSTATEYQLYGNGHQSYHHHHNHNHNHNRNNYEVC